uniref:Ig-like domain-containing protein n=1 Tax=Sarcophilus harrisii TaxID=9305 RepID=A0A7N4PGA8_SARHA
MEKLQGASLVILCLQVFWVSCQQKVEQSPLSLQVQEGENTAFNCSYSDSGSQGLQWFKQDFGKGFISLFSITSEEKEKGRLKSTINRKERLSTLYITASQPGDSGTYFCGVK